MTDSHPSSPPPILVRRRAVLDRRYRNTLFVGLGVAAAVHGWALLSNPSFEGRPPEAVSSLGVDISLLRPTEVIVDGRALPDGFEWPVLLSNHGMVREALTRDLASSVSAGWRGRERFPTAGCGREWGRDEYRTRRGNG